MDKKKEASKINFKIKNLADLERVYELLDQQGFGYTGSWKAHEQKVQRIIDKANTLGLDYSSTLKSDNLPLKDYSEIEKNITAYFSKFGADDKIKEFLNKFYLQEDARGRTPYSSSTDTKEIIEWVTFKTKYGLKDEFGRGNTVDVYYLDKPTIKVRFGDNYNRYDFNKFYKLIFNEECIEIDANYSGWQDLGKIEIKLFQNGNLAMKGDLKKIKEYHYNYLKNTKNSNMVIRYNKKTEIIKNNIH